MDFSLDADQVAILDAVGTLLSRHAGAGRLRVLGGDMPRYDDDLEQHLSSAGFLDLVDQPQRNRLDAALVQEAISVALGSVASSYRLLVWPSIPAVCDGPIAIVPDGYCGPARFAADARTLLVLGADEVRLLDTSRLSLKRIDSRLAWPVGQIVDLPKGGTPLDVHPDEIRSWVQVALAIELVGAMRFALDLVVGYVIDRHQFGRAIGSFQAVQHGLAECAVLLEGARWLALEAAWNGEPTSAALALTHAVGAADTVFSRTHQYTGAIGFTQEYDLHLATMRLPALRAEARLHGQPAAVSANHIWGCG